tara:strand:+ start:1152 stop:1475 length:324 start_codon:yes stop_codon:yes gene_type:complete
MGKYYNITANTPATLVTIDTTITGQQYGGAISSISICNNSVQVAIIDLKLKAHDASIDTDEVYMLNNVNIPPGVTLLLDHDISFNVDRHKLKLTNTGSSPDVTVIIK